MYGVHGSARQPRSEQNLDYENLVYPGTTVFERPGQSKFKSGLGLQGSDNCTTLTQKYGVEQLARDG
jgi:hypothetical protein